MRKKRLSEFTVVSDHFQLVEISLVIGLHSVNEEVLLFPPVNIASKICEILHNILDKNINLTTYKEKQQNVFYVVSNISIVF